MSLKSVLFCACVALACTSGGIAGPLVPPMGPIQPTRQTVIDSLPYTISEPGSYILTGNLTGSALQDGIILEASDVTIDLNGFTLRGVTDSGNGISFSMGVSSPRITIMNGNITNWDGAGILINSPVRIIDVNVSLCGGNGFDTSGTAQLIRCTAFANSGSGFVVDFMSLLDSCISVNHINSNGFQSIAHVTYRNCMSQFNGVGYLASGNASFTDCVAHANSTAGFDAGPSSQIQGCLALQNGVGI